MRVGVVDESLEFGGGEVVNAEKVSGRSGGGSARVEGCEGACGGVYL